MKRTLVLLVLLVPFFSFAQVGQNYVGGYNGNPRGGNNGYGGGYRYNDMQYDNSVLSIFSENGEPFFLILNGVKQNLIPQSKIRVEGLPKFMNDVQIVFTDNRTQPIRKTVNVVDPVDGRAVNLTLRISRGRQGLAKLKFHRMSECDKGYRGPRDEYVMYYGKPQQINTVTETTYMDPITGQWVTETTSTTTTGTRTGYTDRGYYDNNTNYGTPQPVMPAAMALETFNEVKQSIANASFEDTKLSTAKTILNTNYITTNQVMEICNLFSFENTKMTFAQYAYPRTVDPQNYFKVAGVLSFDANKKALNNFISRNQR